MSPAKTNIGQKSNRDLIAECLQGNEVSAWQEFVSRFEQLISGVVAGIVHRYGDASSGLIADLTQETYLKLCANNCRLLRELKLQNDESFFGYLKVVAANVARDYFRAEHAKKRGPNSYGGEPEVAEKHQALNARTHSSPDEERVLLAEIERYLEKVTQGSTAKRDRLVFHLYYRQGLTARAIAELPALKLTEKGVESLLHRITSALRRELVTNGVQKLSAKA